MREGQPGWRVAGTLIALQRKFPLKIAVLPRPLVLMEEVQTWTFPGSEIKRLNLVRAVERTFAARLREILNDSSSGGGGGGGCWTRVRKSGQ